MRSAWKLSAKQECRTVRTMVGVLIAALLACTTGCGSGTPKKKSKKVAASSSKKNATTAAKGNKPTAPRAPRPIETVPPAVAARNDVAALAWVTPFGPGGAIAPALEQPSAVEAVENDAHRFSRLTGAVFPADRDEIIFLGVLEPGLPLLDPEELLDGFVVAFRSLHAGVAPGVTIDPLPAQVSRGLQDGDLMEVKYFGEARGTALGFASFEADRLMKCLSMGKNNLDNSPFECRVAGFRNEFDLLDQFPESRKQSWHRFWIQPASSSVRHSADGRTLLVETKLEVQTRHMVPRNGKLVDSQEEAAGSARQFSGHLTSEYLQYAREFPIFAKLQAYADLTTLAQACLSHASSDAQDAGDAARARPALDLNWILEQHVPQPTATPDETPARQMSKTRTVETKTGNVTRIEKHEQRVEGGVTLAPKNRYAPDAAAADAMQTAVQQAREREPGRSAWTLPGDGVAQRAVAVRRTPDVTAWQQDLLAGTTPLVRQYSSSASTGELGPGWNIRRPRLRMSNKKTQYDGLGEMAQWVAVEIEPGHVVRLDRAGMVSLPDVNGVHQQTPGFLNAEKTARLACYSNAWIFLEGDVQFLSQNNGPYVPSPQAGARYAVFSPKGDHPVETVTADGASVKYTYEQGRLAGIAGGDGASLRLNYDDEGRCRQVESSSGGRVQYGYFNGRLAAVFNDREQRLVQHYSEEDGSLSGISADEITLSGTAAPLGSRLAVGQSPPRSELRNLSAKLDSPAVGFVDVDWSTGATRSLEATIGGKAAAVKGNLEQLINLVERKNDSEAAGTLRRMFDGLHGKEQVVITAPSPDISGRVRRVLSTLLPDVRFYTTTDPVRANENLLRQSELERVAPERKGIRVIVHYDGLTDDAAKPLRQIELETADEKDPAVIVFAGHNSGTFCEFIASPENQKLIQGRKVVLATCHSREKPQLVESALRHSGAMSVASFSQKIEQGLLAPFVSQALAVAKSVPADKPLRLPQLLQQAVDRIEQGIADKTLELKGAIGKPQIQNLRLQDHQTNARRHFDSVSVA